MQAVVDQRLGLNFIECEENSEGQVHRSRVVCVCRAWRGLTSLARLQRLLDAAVDILAQECRVRRVCLCV